MRKNLLYTFIASAIAQGTVWAAVAPLCYEAVDTECFYVGPTGTTVCAGDNNASLALKFPLPGADGNEASDPCGTALRSTTLDIFDILLQRKVKIVITINEKCGDLQALGKAYKEH